MVSGPNLPLGKVLRAYVGQKLGESAFKKLKMILGETKLDFNEIKP